MTADRAEEGALVVPLPEPTGRRMRLGPFPSVRDALKFVTVAAVGSVVAALAGPGAWLPFLGGGFALAIGRVDGKPPDERAVDYVEWRLRGSRWGRRRGATRSATGREGIVRLEGGRWAVVLAVSGIPVAYRPPAEARRLFDAFRRWLRETEGVLYFSAATEVIDGRSLMGDHGRPGSAAESVARAGHDEMLALLVRRRRKRRVTVILSVPGQEPRSLERLERRCGQAVAGLAAMGLAVERLRGRRLVEELRAQGWSPGSKA